MYFTLSVVTGTSCICVANLLLYFIVLFLLAHEFDKKTIILELLMLQYMDFSKNDSVK